MSAEDGPAPGWHGRLDDLATGRGLVIGEPVRRLTAMHPDDVVPVLAEVERATADGAWAIGFVGYEAAAGLDPLCAVPDRAAGERLPLVQFLLADSASEVPAVAAAGPDAPAYAVGPWRRRWDRDGYTRDVERIRACIAAGTTYQLNHTVRLDAPFTGSTRTLYADLAHAQGGAHAAYLDLGGHVVASASPELFFEWTDEGLLTRPMKGTARRGADPAEDARLRAALLGSAKERAENVMIVDLLRNDLGRIATAGSVAVPALLTAERYETVWQLTSTVVARPRPGTGLVDVFRALFPSGSVTGAPKLASMALIRALEPTPRGVYCGAVGVVAPPGQAFRARFNVAIRTVTVDRATARAAYGTGGGITWSSRAEDEHAELLVKAAVLDRLRGPVA